jgi:hypothetical protein
LKPLEIDMPSSGGWAATASLSESLKIAITINP